MFASKVPYLIFVEDGLSGFFSVLQIVRFSFQPSETNLTNSGSGDDTSRLGVVRSIKDYPGHPSHVVHHRGYRISSLFCCCDCE